MEQHNTGTVCTVCKKQQLFFKFYFIDVVVLPDFASRFVV